MNKYTYKKLREDYLSFQYSLKDLYIKYNITLKQLNEFLKKPSFRKIVIDGKIVRKIVIDGKIVRKKCFTCECWKDVSEYVVKNRHLKTTSYHKNCKYCHNTIQRNRFILDEDFKQRYLGYAKKSYEKHKEKKKLYDKEYYKKNKEKKKIADRIRYRKNKEKALNKKLNAKRKLINN